jgi:hypothetical protein
MQDPTEKHFGDVGILDKYNNNNNNSTVVCLFLVICAEKVGQLISELSRELLTNEIALFSIVLSAEFGQKNLHSTENKSEKNINIKIFLQNLKCCSATTKDLLISAKICEVNFCWKQTINRL